MGHVDSKTISVTEILEKRCVHSRGHNFRPLIMKLGQNVYHDKISDSLKMGQVSSKTRSPSQILEKLCIHKRRHNFSPIIMKLTQNVVLDEIFENGSCRVKN